MKKILVLGAAFIMSSTVALAQDHMFSFNADSVMRGILSIEKSKAKGTSATNNTQLDLELNYAYRLPTMPLLQVGGQIMYDKGAKPGRGDMEDYGLKVGAILNMDNDLMNSPYASLFVGYTWANNYDQGGGKDEVFSSVLAVGKRFSLEPLGIKHLVYTPEVALENLNSTTGSSLVYAQNIQFRFLQFSVFF